MKGAIFSKIKKEYNNFYRSLLQKGRLPMWSTEKGFWNASSSDEIYNAFKKIGLGKFKSFLDIGSGDGKVVLIASLFCKSAQGIEIDDLLHHKAVEIQEKIGIKNANFLNSDFFGHDFSKYSVLFLSPDSPLERGLEDKLLKEMKGKLLHHGHHFHPKSLKKESSFLVDGNLFSFYKLKNSL